MARYGIGMTWTITNSAQAIEVLRYDDDGTGNPSTGTETSMATLEPGSTGYIDFLPNNNTIYHYRVRHTETDWTAGGYSAYLRAKARIIPQFGQAERSVT